MENVQTVSEGVIRTYRTVWKLTGAKKSFAEYLAHRGLTEAPPPPLPAAPATSVYFIGAADGPVKIGFARCPALRLDVLQTGHPYKLAILAVTDGGSTLEREYHRRFAAHRLHGEWFTRCPEIEAEIARLSTPPQEVH